MRRLPLLAGVCVLLSVAGCNRPAPVTPPAVNVTGTDDSAAQEKFATASSVLKQLRLRLDDADPTVRRTALREVEKQADLTDADRRTLLTRAFMKDADPQVRIVALEMTQRLGGIDMAPALRDRDARVRLRAALLMIQSGKTHADLASVLAAAMADPKAGAREDVLKLAEAGGPAARAAAPGLIALAQAPGEPLRLRAVQALGRASAAPEAVDALILLAHDDELRVRQTALRALGEASAGSAKVRATLMQALRDPTHAVQVAALEGIAQGGPVCMPELARQMRSSDKCLRLRALELAGTLGPQAREAIPELVAALNENGREVAPVALEALGRMGADAVYAVPAMIEAIRVNPPIEDDAVRAITRIGVGAVPTLIESLRHPDERLRHAIALTLGRIGPGAAPAAESLRRMQKDDPSERVRTAARTALARITNHPAGP